MRNGQQARIVIVVNRPEFFLSHRIPIARAARASGNEVHVVSPSGPAVADIMAKGYTWHQLELDGKSLNPLSELRTLFDLLRIYRRIKPDLAHHVAFKLVLSGGLAARLAGVPCSVNAFTGLGYLFTTDSAMVRMIRFAVVQMCRIALGHPRSCTIFQNIDDMSFFVDRGIVDRGKTRLIKGSGVDVNEFIPTPEPSGVPVVMLASRLVWDKGVAEFVEAAELLDERGIEARFVLVGESDPLNPKAIPTEQLEAWDESGVIEWWGFQDDMPKVFSEVHIVCLPSYREGLPKVLIEAAASGRPIIATDVPGCREIVRNRVNGRLVPPENSRALSDALRELLGNAERRRRMGEQGRKIVEEEFCLDKVVSQTMDVYERLLCDAAGAAREFSG